MALASGSLGIVPAETLGAETAAQVKKSGSDIRLCLLLLGVLVVVPVAVDFLGLAELGALEMRQNREQRSHTPK
jgi:hypothetical protein